MLRIRGWQQGSAIFGFYNDPAKRALLKPEAIYEIELGLKQSAYDITAASVVRSEWYQAVRGMFEKYDYFIVPTAQLFPFEAEIHWPQEIAGQKMKTYHEWMKAVLLVSMSGCPALAVPAGFGGERNLPMGIQIIAPNHREIDCLRFGLRFHKRGDWTNARLPALLSGGLATRGGKRFTRLFPASRNAPPRRVRFGSGGQLSSDSDRLSGGQRMRRPENENNVGQANGGDRRHDRHPV